MYDGLAQSWELPGYAEEVIHFAILKHRKKLNKYAQLLFSTSHLLQLNLLLQPLNFICGKSLEYPEQFFNSFFLLVESPQPCQDFSVSQVKHVYLKFSISDLTYKLFCMKANFDLAHIHCIIRINKEFLIFHLLGLSTTICKLKIAL